MARAPAHMIATDHPNGPSISADSLAERLAGDIAPGSLLLAARSPAEYAMSHLRGARRVPPPGKDYSVLDTITVDNPTLVYGSVGYGSADVVQTLRQKDFTNVANVEGVLSRWTNEGDRSTGGASG